MNKLLTKIVGAVLGTSMAVGVGTAVVAKSNKAIDSQVMAAYSLAYSFDFASASSGSGSPTELTTDTALTFLNASGSNIVQSVSSTAKCYDAKGSGGTGVPSKVFKIGTGSAAGSITFTLKNDCDSVSKAVLHVYSWPKKAVECTFNGETETRESTNATSQYDLTFEFSATKEIVMSVPSDHALSCTTLDLYKTTSGGTLTVTYNGNGNDSGTVPVDNNTYAANDSVTVLGNTGNLSKVGFTFSGWGTQTSGGAVGNSFTITENTVLYAQWTANKYSVTYNGNGSDGGTVPTDATEYSHNAVATVLGAGNLSYSGHVFDSWNTSADGSGSEYSSGDTITMTSNVTLYAQWSEIEYLAVKNSLVTVRVGKTYDVRNNITATGAAALSVTYSANEYFSISNFILTANKATVSPISITISKAGNVVEPVSFNVQVLNSSEGTEDDPLSIDEAKELAIEAGTTGTDKGYYIAGYIVGEITYSSKRARLYIGDTADSLESLYIYNMNDFGDVADFASGDLMAGDYIVVFGALKTYNDVPQVCYIQNVSSCKLVGIDPVNYSLTLSSHEKTIYVGESFVLTATDTRPYLGGFSWSTKDDTTGGDFTFADGAFEAGDTKGTVTIVITSEFDENIKDECVVTINKKLPVPTTTGSFVKVTKTSDVVEGDYLIVYETGNVAFDGSLGTLDASSNTISLTDIISEGVIESNSTTNGAIFHITPVAGGFTIQSASGFYIDKTANSNGLDSKTTVMTNKSITISSGNAIITASGDCTLQFNKTSGQERFRYFKTVSQEAIQLYKFEEGSTEDHKVILCRNILDFLECDSTGETAPSVSEWNQIKDLYNATDFLSSEDKTTLQTATADKTIVITDSSTDEQIIAAALAKYDYVLSKYGSSTYNNFLGRTISPLTAPRIMVFNNSNESVVVTTAVMSLLAMTTLGGYFLLRKRKEER